MDVSQYLAPTSATELWSKLIAPYHWPGAIQAPEVPMVLLCDYTFDPSCLAPVKYVGFRADVHGKMDQHVFSCAKGHDIHVSHHYYFEDGNFTLGDVAGLYTFTIPSQEPVYKLVEVTDGPDTYTTTIELVGLDRARYYLAPLGVKL
jgi:hypothetical protein